MVSFSGGDIGFDEGGVLQALSKPFYRREVKTFTYNKKGLLIREVTTHKDIAWSDIIAAGVMIFGPVVMMQFYTKILTNPDLRTAAEKVFRDAINPLNIDTGALQGALGKTLSFFKKAADPLGIFGF